MRHFYTVRINSPLPGRWNACIRKSGRIAYMVCNAYSLIQTVSEVREFLRQVK